MPSSANDVAAFATHLDNAVAEGDQPMSMASEKDSVSSHFVHAALARMAPSVQQRMLGAAGISPELLSVPHARVSAHRYSALWLVIARELDDEFFGLDRRSMKVGSFALLCQAVLPCDKLDHALRRFLRGLAVLLDDIHGELRLSPDRRSVDIVVVNRISDDAARLFADETFLILIHGVMCWLIGRRLVLQRVAFAHPRPPHAREYALMFSEHASFGAAFTAMRFDAATLDAPLVQNAASLRQFLASAPRSVILKYRNEDSWTARLRRYLRLQLDAGRSPIFEAVAAEFGQAATTLRRRLADEGTSYQGVKDGLRNDLAIDRLGNSALSVDDIAAHLGYRDVSAFHRAFKRWNGLQPGEYRRRSLSAGAARPTDE